MARYGRGIPPRIINGHGPGLAQEAALSPISIAVTAVALAPSILFSNLVEDFADALTNPPWDLPNSTYTLDSGRLRLQLKSDYSQLLVSQETYSLIGGEVWAQMETPAGTDSFVNALLSLWSDGFGVRAEFGRVNDKLYVRERVSTGNFVTTSNIEAWSATNHAWLRMREASGTLYFDTSPDGITWTNKHSCTHAFNPLLSLSYAVNAGYNAATPSPAQYIYLDNVNVPAPQTAALTPITVPVTPVALGVTPGAVTAALTPITVPVTPVALGTSAAASAALTPVEVAVELLALPWVLLDHQGKLENLTDDFSSGVGDWDNDFTALVSVVAGELVIEPGGYTDPTAAVVVGGNNYTGKAWDLTDSFMFVEFDPGDVSAFGRVQFAIQSWIPEPAGGNGGSLYFEVSQGDIAVGTGGAWGSGPGAVDTYDPVAHRWLKIGLAGSTLTWETSPDGSTWTAFDTDTLDAEALVGAENVHPYFSPDNVDDLHVDNVNIAGVGDASVALSPIVIPVTPVALGTTVGGVSNALTPVTVPVEAQALTAVPGAVSAALTPITVPVELVALTGVAAASVALTPVEVPVTPQALGVSSGAVSAALSPVTVPVEAVALGASAAASVALTPVTVPVEPSLLGTTVGAVTAGLTPVTVPVELPALARLAVSDLALSPIVIPVTPQALGRTAGAASAALTPLEVAVLAQLLGVATSGGGADSVSLSPIEVAVTAMALGAVPGGVSAALTPVEVTVTGVALGVSAAKSVGLTPVTITVEAMALARTAAADVALTPVTIQVQGVALGQSAAASAALTPVSIPVTPQALGTTVGAVSAALTPVTVPVVAQPLAPAAGGISSALTPVTITVEAVPLGIAMAVALSPVVINVEPVALAALFSGVSVALTPIEIGVVMSALTVLVPGLPSIEFRPTHANLTTGPRVHAE